MLHFRQLVDRFGAKRFDLGADMPNVERYCTYRQTFTCIRKHADFLTDTDRQAICRDNALALFSRLRTPMLSA
jgi:hypothetical protein